MVFILQGHFIERQQLDLSREPFPVTTLHLSFSFFFFFFATSLSTSLYDSTLRRRLSVRLSTEMDPDIFTMSSSRLVWPNNLIVVVFAAWRIEVAVKRTI